MWRSAGVSYLRYICDMADILRQCLKEPYKAQAMLRNQVHVRESVFKSGSVLHRTVHNNLSEGFKKSP